MNEDISMERRLTTLEVRQSTHEEECATRWGIVVKLVAAIGAIMIAVTGWSMTQIHNDQQQQMQMLQRLVQKP